MLEFGSHLHPPRFDQDRRQHLVLLIEESIQSGGPPAIRTWNEGKSWVRRTAADGAHYDYRAILPDELVFDLGDLVEGEPRPWADTVRDVTDLLTVLNWLGEPYWCSLSDGKGWHIQLFLGRREDGSIPDREEVAKNIIVSIHAGRGYVGALRHPFICDWRLIDPAEGSRQLREFGAKKSGHTPYGKALWTVGPGPFEAIPDSLEATYARLKERIERGEDLRIPRGIVHGMPLVQLREVYNFARSQGGLCPQSIDCVPGPHRDASDWGTCQRCPLDA